ncbi:MAG TPA: hypothetical protein VLB06_05175 [Sulfuricaulis sp.]|nr:hypothetical protein [Sulfuricaulis sp.]
MKSTNIISTIDPINGFNITSLEDRPHLVEGDDTNSLTIYFETKSSLQAYLDIPVEHPEQDLSKTQSNPTGDYTN